MRVCGDRPRVAKAHRVLARFCALKSLSFFFISVQRSSNIPLEGGRFILAIAHTVLARFLGVNVAMEFPAADGRRVLLDFCGTRITFTPPAKCQTLDKVCRTNPTCDAFTP